MILELVAFVVLVLVVLFLLFAGMRLREAVQIKEQATVDFFLMQAILAAERGARLSAENIGAKLDGADRAELARAAYETLPPKWRTAVGDKDEFEARVSGLYDELVGLWARHRGYFLGEVERIIHERKN